MSSPASFPNCADAGFKSDSWVPSVSQSPVYVKCKIEGGSSATLDQCSSYNLLNRLGGCSGCMDSSSITSEYTAKSDVVAAMHQRYKDCDQFGFSFGNLWQNFYKVKRDKLAPVLARVQNARD